MKPLNSQKKERYKSGTYRLNTGFSPHWLFSLLLFCCSTSLIGQTVSGTVSDTDGETLIGVNILVKGTSTGTTTDFDGNYSINVPEGSTELVFSYIGYNDLEVAIDGRSQVDVVLSTNAQVLDEVVVIGYGVQKKSDLTGSVAKISGKELTAIVAGNPTTALQGKLSGVQVESFGGQPGGDANVFVRGINSLTNAAPLYVIDGTFAENMNYLNPNDIESIEVLKDASAAAIYGSRAANGVVLITTKKGRAGDVVVDVNLRSGVESASKMLEYMNGEEFLDYREYVESISTNFAIDRNEFTENGQVIDTDWQDLSINNGMLYDLGMGISGGTEDASFYLSGNYFSQDGILVGSGFERLNGRINSQFKFGRFTIEESLSLSQTKTQENEWFGFEGPTIPILRENVPENEGGFEAPDNNALNIGGINKYALASLEDNLDNRKNVLANLNIGFDIMEGLVLKLNLGADYTNRYRYTFRPTYFMSETDPRFNVNENNDLTNVRSELLQTQIEPYLNFTRSFGNNNLNVVVGFSQIVSQFDDLATFVEGLPNNDTRAISAASTDQVVGIAGNTITSALRSQFGRINYSFDNKYYLTGTIRRDESSKFAPENRVGVFPSFSVGWKVSNENFFPSDGVLSNLKIRGGYGTLGAQNIGDYQFQPVFNVTSNSSFGGQIVQGYAQTEIVDESIKWETTKTSNIGVDFGFWQDKFTLSADYYIKDIEDVLAGVNIPSSNGTNIPVVQNIGTMKSSGLEIEAVFKGRGNKLKYDITANLATQNSEIVSLPNPIVGPSVNEAINIVNIFDEGQEPGAFYGFEVEGVDPATGDFIYVDQNNDNTLDEEDEVVLGSPIPDLIYGFGFSGTSGKLDFGIFFNGVTGVEIYNQARNFATFFEDDNKLRSLVNDQWRPDNTGGTIARANPDNGIPSSFFVEDGSYLRLRSLSVGYDLTEAIGVGWVKGLRLSITAQNLFVLTNYSGYDPDVSSTYGARSDENQGFFGYRNRTNNILGRGIDIRAYPNTRSFVFGINATF